MDFTVDDFIKFFEEKKKGVYSCQFCGSEHFFPAMNIRGDAAGRLVVVLDPPPGIIEPGHHDFYGLVCSNCGRTDLFHYNTVAAWKANKTGGAT